ncbi:uncharacterized protein LOC104864823 isoform X2 [Fukomys damarensis]|uniref:uncharacterized protein LOC104864823 isoform X2 n=1 Tax=Fukomys damarensis TaxID=885580 RepID=UPI0014552675|nr:uncharacterized protein LOC104864823 isoform X2 [Fukomys damarensis]
MRVCHPLAVTLDLSLPPQTLLPHLQKRVSLLEVFQNSFQPRAPKASQVPQGDCHQRRRPPAGFHSPTLPSHIVHSQPWSPVPERKPSPRARRQPQRWRPRPENMPWPHSRQNKGHKTELGASGCQMGPHPHPNGWQRRWNRKWEPPEPSQRCPAALTQGDAEVTQPCVHPQHRKTKPTSAHRGALRAAAAQHRVTGCNHSGSSSSCTGSLSLKASPEKLSGLQILDLWALALGLVFGFVCLFVTGSCFVVQAGLELSAILLPRPPHC